jgi:hypothetical protein
MVVTMLVMRAVTSKEEVEEGTASAAEENTSESVEE